MIIKKDIIRNFIVKSMFFMEEMLLIVGLYDENIYLFMLFSLLITSFIAVIVGMLLKYEVRYFINVLLMYPLIYIYMSYKIQKFYYLNLEKIFWFGFTMTIMTLSLFIGVKIYLLVLKDLKKYR